MRLIFGALHWPHSAIDSEYCVHTHTSSLTHAIYICMFLERTSHQLLHIENEKILFLEFDYTLQRRSQCGCVRCAYLHTNLGDATLCEWWFYFDSKRMLGFSTKLEWHSHTSLILFVVSARIRGKKKLKLHSNWTEFVEFGNSESAKRRSYLSEVNSILLIY